jgi:DNA-binding Lrp family transcriptional regulator
MVTAIVLIDCERGRIQPVAEALAAIDGVAEVYSVAGRHDLVAIVRVADNDAMAALVTSGLLAVDGISRTETLTAFRAYSQHDLEAMFDFGAD